MDSQNENDKNTIDGGWVQWAKYILLTIQKHDKIVSDNEKAIEDLKRKYDVLLVKVGIIVFFGTLVIGLVGQYLLSLIKP